MHSDFWPIFQQNRHLLDDLPALAAGVLQDWADLKYNARVIVLAVRHTFGSYLKFNSHVHLLVSTIGITKTGSKLIANLRYPRNRVMRLWRQTLIDYLRRALEFDRIRGNFFRSELKLLFDQHYDRWWTAQVDYLSSKGPFTNYISRYLRRPPIAEHKLLPSDQQFVRFKTFDTFLQKNVPVECTGGEFIARLSHQFDGGDPVSIRASREVGQVLRSYGAD
jgi:hypothetical protein